MGGARYRGGGLPEPSAVLPMAYSHSAPSTNSCFCPFSNPAWLQGNVYNKKTYDDLRRQGLV